MSSFSTSTTYQRRSGLEIARIRAGLRNGVALSLFLYGILIVLFLVLR